KDSDVDLVYAGASSARLSALESGAVDAAILTAPFNFYGASAGLSIIGRTADYITDLPQNGTVVNRNCATGHISTLTRFLAAFNKGVDWCRDDRNRDEAINILVISPFELRRWEAQLGPSARISAGCLRGRNCRDFPPR